MMNDPNVESHLGWSALSTLTRPQKLTSILKPLPGAPGVEVVKLNLNKINGLGLIIHIHSEF